MKVRNALGILFAGLPLVGTLLLETIMRVQQSNSNFNLVQTVIVNNTFPESGSIGITCL